MTQNVPRCRLVEEVLPIDDLIALQQYTIDNQHLFAPAKVIGDANRPGIYHQRRGRVMHEVSPIWPLVSRSVRPHVERFCYWCLDVMPPQMRMTAEIAANTVGDYFEPHIDSSVDASRNRHGVDDRRVTFVLFCHFEPARFYGGELVIYNSGAEAAPDSVLTRIPPRQNVLVLFDSRLLHEVTLIGGSDTSVGSSRMSVTGWAHW